MMNKNKVFLLIFIGILVFLVLYDNLLYPSYLSYAAQCSNLDLEEVGYITAGTYTPSTDEIYINPSLTEKQKISTQKHELVHRYQNLVGRRNGCDEPFGVYLNELEAYSGEYLSINTFNQIYNFSEIYVEN